MDIVSSSVRSRMMSGIRGNNTRPEMIVRKYLHAAGHAVLGTEHPFGAFKNGHSGGTPSQRQQPAQNRPLK